MDNPGFEENMRHVLDIIDASNLLGRISIQASR